MYCFDEVFSTCYNSCRKILGITFEIYKNLGIKRAKSRDNGSVIIIIIIIIIIILLLLLLLLLLLFLLLLLLLLLLLQVIPVKVNYDYFTLF